MNDLLHNVNVTGKAVLPTPEQVIADFPLSDQARRTVANGRDQIKRILNRQDQRIFVVVGPCSIHDVDAAMDYAQKLRELADQLDDALLCVMRVYFEKPRTTVGWKGLINDPDLDGTFRIEKGVKLARQLLLDLAELGLPAATEALDPIMPQYLGDLTSWTAIGARTVESQTHRELASGLSTPVGFKNGTDGSIAVAVDAVGAARNSHHFLGISKQGQPAVFATRGNPDGHLVLRGGGGRPNYDPVSIALCEQQLNAADLPANIVVDCSHGNSAKNPSLQPLVTKTCIDQIVFGCRSIVGLMLESHLNAGNQRISGGRSNLLYGVSVTDACMDWATTEETLRAAHHHLSSMRADT